jgi:hypothetical protein
LASLFFFSAVAFLLLAVHHHHFEEVNHRLAEYEETSRKVESDRRDFALKYLAQLRTDFEHLALLLNLAAKFVPDITLRGEIERFWVRVRFRLEYRLARLQIRFGVIPTVRLKALTARVRLLARSADQFLNDIAREHGLHVLKSDLNR